MKKIKSNQSGATLIWAMVMITVMMIFVGTLLTLSLSYTSRSTVSNSNKQAYFTALSAINAVSSQIKGEENPNSAGYKFLAKLGESGSTMIKDIGFPESMGKCSVLVEKEKDNITITADAKSGNGTYKMACTMARYRARTEKPPKPDPKPDVPIELGLNGFIYDVVPPDSKEATGIAATSDTNLYIYNGGKGSMPLSLAHKNPYNKLDVEGAVYSQNGLNISGESGTNHVHGKIVSDGMVDIRDKVVVGKRPQNCTNQTEGGIYTKGIVMLSGDCIVYGDITASYVDISGNAKVIGNIVADEVYIATGTSDAAVQGNITAGMVTIINNSHVQGNIKTNALSVGGMAVVAGNVTAYTSISIGMVQGDDPIITGNITTSDLNMRGFAKAAGMVNTINLNMTESASIVGNAKAKLTKLGQTAGHKYVTETLTTVNYTDINQSLVGALVLYSDAFVPPIKKQDEIAALKLASMMPVKPEQPVFKPITTGMQTIVPKTDNFGQKIATVSANAVDTYYEVNKDLDFNTLKVEGNGKIYIYVRQGKTISFGTMQGISAKKTNVYFILEKNARLDISKEVGLATAKEFGGHVFGAEGKVKLGNNIKVYGNMLVKEIDIAKNVTLQYVPPDLGTKPDIPGTEPPVEGKTVFAWAVTKYEKK